MRFALLAALVVSSTTATAQTASDSEAVITLQPGERRVLSLPNVTRIAIGDAEIAEAKVDGDDVALTGRSEGKTTLMLWQGSVRKAFLLHVKGAGRAEAETTRATAVPPNETLALRRGEKRVLAFRKLRRLAIGKPEVAEVRTTEAGDIEVRALTAGGTELIVWREGEPRYTIRVEVR